MLRILHAVLQLNGATPGYPEWLAALPDWLPSRLSMRHLAALLRRHVPQLQNIMLIGIDEANAAKDDWVKNMISEIVMINSRAVHDDGALLLLPVIATSRSTAADLQGTASGRTQAGIVPLPTLNMALRRALVQGLLANAGTPLDLASLDTLKTKLLDVLLQHVGGNPRMLLTMLACLCNQQPTGAAQQCGEHTSADTSSKTGQHPLLMASVYTG